MSNQFIVLSFILLFVLVCTAGIASSPSTSILVDYEGSWTLQYKILYNEVGNSTIRQIYGFGRREITIEREKDFTAVCAWLKRVGSDNYGNMKLHIVVKKNGIETKKTSPPSLFKNKCSLCYHLNSE